MQETEQPEILPEETEPAKQQGQPPQETPAVQDEAVLVAREALYLAPYSSFYPAQGNSGFVYSLGETAFHMYDQNTGAPLISRRLSLSDWKRLDSEHICWGWLSEAGLEPEQYEEVLYLGLEDKYFLLKLDGRLCIGSGYDRTGLWELYALQPYGDPARCELYNSRGQWLFDLDPYEGEYDYKHYGVSTLRVSGDLTYWLKPTWDCDSLTVILDYYEAVGSGRVSDLQTVELQREDGAFALQVDHRNEDTEEQLIVRVPYEGGEYVVRIELQAAAKDPLEAAEWELRSLDGYAGHEILTHHTVAVDGADGSSHEDVTVYAMTAFYLEDTELTYWLPTVLEYYVDADGLGITGFWTPEEYKSYLPQIEEKFPAVNLDEEETAMLHSKAIAARVDHLLMLVHAYGDVYPDMEALLQGFAGEHAELLSYGDHTLLYIYRDFLNGNEVGVKGNFMCRLLTEMTEVALLLEADNGQEYFDAWKQHLQQEAEKNGEAWVQENYPKAWLLLDMLKLE